jgi:hypothetical protein
VTSGYILWRQRITCVCARNGIKVQFLAKKFKEYISKKKFECDIASKEIRKIKESNATTTQSLADRQQAVGLDCLILYVGDGKLYWQNSSGKRQNISRALCQIRRMLTPTRYNPCLLL